jgi:hypothetical protein
MKVCYGGAISGITCRVLLGSEDNEGNSLSPGLKIEPLTSDCKAWLLPVTL